MSELAEMLKHKSPRVRKKQRQVEKDDSDDLSVHAEDSFRDNKGLDPLITLKRGKAVMSRHGFSRAQPECYQVLDAHLKHCLREIVSRALLTAARRNRSFPNKHDAIIAIQEMGIFPSIILG